MKSLKIFAIASVFFIAALAAGEKENNSPAPGQLGLGRKMMNREGRPGERPRNFIEENLPGAKEEIARHEEVMKAIKDKAKTLAEEIKAAIQAAATPEAKREVSKSYEPKIRAIAAEIVDERLNHDQKMLELRKANRDQAVDKTVKMIIGGALAKKDGMGAGPLPLRENLREKIRERRAKHEGESASGANPQPPATPPSHSEEGESSQPPAPNPSPQADADSEQAIADELTAALEQALL